ncbi:MAG: hypothetical protein LBF41_08495 [Deltaproteobacteria bacterium]|nr:hypothetical protein [Deltaproteobacteria bacterium]
MLSKRLGIVAVLFASLVFVPSLMSQTGAGLTDGDVDVYIKVLSDGNLTDMDAIYKTHNIQSEAERSLFVKKVEMISAIAVGLSGNSSDKKIIEALKGINPNYQITQADLDVVKKRKRTVVSLTKKVLESAKKNNKS